MLRIAASRHLELDGVPDDPGRQREPVGPSRWHERNYLPDASRIDASVFLVHGLQDDNVRPDHFGKYWERLEQLGVPRKLWLRAARPMDAGASPDLWSKDPGGTP